MISSHVRCDWCETSLAPEPGYGADSEFLLEGDGLELLRGWDEEEEDAAEAFHFCSQECLVRWAVSDEVDIDELAGMLKAKRAD